MMPLRPWLEKIFPYIVVASWHPSSTCTGIDKLGDFICQNLEKSWMCRPPCIYVKTTSFGKQNWFSTTASCSFKYIIMEFLIKNRLIKMSTTTKKFKSQHTKKGYIQLTVGLTVKLNIAVDMHFIALFRISFSEEKYRLFENQTSTYWRTQTLMKCSVFNYFSSHIRSGEEIHYLNSS